MARAKGFQMIVENGKALADSLDGAVDPNNPMLNTLFRMLTTRCMTQAVYFASGWCFCELLTHPSIFRYIPQKKNCNNSFM